MSGPNGHGYSTFFCPHCDAELNPGGGPIVKVRGRLHSPTFSVTTNLFLSARLGVYGRMAADHVELREGAKIEFFCPTCDESFSQSEDDDLVTIRMRDDDGRVFMVSFNKHYGKRSTFVVDPAGRVDRTFGRDADSYRVALDKPVNFFGA